MVAEDVGVGVQSEQRIEFQDNKSLQPNGGPDGDTKVYLLEQLSGFKDSIISNFIGIFGLFSALVTFLGFGVGIFSKMENAQSALGLMLVLLGGVLTLTLAAHMFNRYLDWKKVGVIVFLILISMISGLILVLRGENVPIKPPSANQVTESIIQSN